MFGRIWHNGENPIIFNYGQNQSSEEIMWMLNYGSLHTEGIRLNF